MASSIRNQGGRLQVEMDLDAMQSMFLGRGQGQGRGVRVDLRAGWRFQVSWHFLSGRGYHKLPQATAGNHHASKHRHPVTLIRIHGSL